MIYSFESYQRYSFASSRRFTN